MKPWTVEHGTFWLSDAAPAAAPAASGPAPLTFGELFPTEAPALQAAMRLAQPEPIRARFAAGRRCFGLKAGEAIAAYGWATRGRERVGELERELDLHNDEAYIWDCWTVPAWRRQGCYTHLLAQIRRQLHQEGLGRVWIGAGRHNRPSVQGIAAAGFQHVTDLTYLRWAWFTLLWFTEARAARPDQIEAAYRVLMGGHGQRLGRVVVGRYRPGAVASAAPAAQGAAR